MAQWLVFCMHIQEPNFGCPEHMYTLSGQWISPVISSLEDGNKEMSTETWLIRVAISVNSGFSLEPLPQWTQWKSNWGWFPTLTLGLHITCACPYMNTSPHRCTNAHTHISTTHIHGNGGGWTYKIYKIRWESVASTPLEIYSVSVLRICSEKMKIVIHSVQYLPIDHLESGLNRHSVYLLC